MEVEVYSQILNGISTVGFPIFVAVFMLTKGQRDQERTIEVINELKLAIQQLKN